MASITNYSGDKDMGFGANSNISAVSPEGRSNSVIDDTTNKIMERNHANNVSMFNRKIEDRDSLYKALAAGQVTVGDIYPDDRGYYEKSKKAQSAAFENMSQNGGINNKEAYRKYVESTTDLNQSATHVQARKIGIDKYKEQMAKEPIPAKKKLIEDQLNKQLAKGTDAMIDPYQAVSDWNGDAFNAIGEKDSTIGGSSNTSTSQTTSTKSTAGKPSVTTTTTKTAPTKGKQVQSINTSGGQSQGGNAAQSDNIIYKGGIPFQVTHQRVDFNKIKANYRDNFMESTGAGADLQQKLYNFLTDPDIISHPEIRETYDEMIKKGEQFNKESGFKPLEDGSMSPEDLANGAADIQKLRKAIASPIDPKTGKRNINMGISELSAYYNLAHRPSFTSSTETEMKDMFEGQIKKAESTAKIGAMKALATERYAKAGLASKKTKLLDKQFNPAQTFNEIFKGRMQSYETTGGTNVTRVNRADIPKAFLDNLGIAPLNKNGDYNVVPANIKYKGVSVPEEQVQGWYKKFLASDKGKQLTEQMKKTPDIFDYMYSIDPHTTFDVEVEGKIAPIIKSVYNKGTMKYEDKVTNQAEAGKVTRSNALQSWINQRKGMGVKGESLLMGESESSDDNDNESESEIK